MNGHRRSVTDEERLLREQKLRERRQDYRHRVKHWVRTNAWVPVARQRLQRVRNEREAQYLKYFTLCAEEAIDVRLFGIQEDLVEVDERGCPQVVFCECYAEQYELIARALGRTNGYKAWFEDLVLDRASPISQDFYSELPFDIYNLDFSGVCFPRADPPFSRTLEAIVSLVEVLGGEASYRRGFDIFVTFRAQRSQENEEAIRQLRRNLSANRRDFPWFDQAFEQNYGPDAGTLVDRQYHQFLLLALPKLLGLFGSECGFRVECLHRLYYPRPSAEHPQYRIISFIMSFDWVGTSSSLARSVRQPSPAHVVTAVAYADMVRQAVEQRPINVSALAYDWDQCERELQALLDIGSF